MKYAWAPFEVAYEGSSAWAWTSPQMGRSGCDYRGYIPQGPA